MHELLAYAGHKSLTADEYPYREQRKMSGDQGNSLLSEHRAGKV